MLLRLIRASFATGVLAAAMLHHPPHGFAAELQSSSTLIRHREILAERSMPAVQPPASSEPFGQVAVTLVSGDVPEKWRLIETEIAAENVILDGCRAHRECPRPAQELLDIVALGRERQGLARIGVINRAVNLAITTTSDMKQWGVADHWSPPLETLATGRGDCEDYAIAKYVALLDAGIAKEDVKLVIVRRRFPDEEHAVVTVRVDGGWLILDNRTHMLVPAIEMRGASPLFILDSVGAKILVAGTSGV
ncbi:MAG TPA: transglutaminase-like cysteine peptidase [Xanthobacteraceae bacterium]|nr:transglutaminase-like cysteine peptidase [Xanthobacteraceae bacterium]